jgi:uroporphyrinogen decarboxylase
MNKRQIVIDILNHKDTSVVPFSILFTIPMREKMIDYLGDPYFESKINSFMHGWEYLGWPEELPDKPGYFKDDFGVVFNRSGADKDIGVIESFVIPQPEIALIPEFWLNEERLRSDLQSCIESSEGQFCFAGIGLSFFERAWTLTGFENALGYMAEAPDFFAALLNKICEFNLQIIDIIAEYSFDAVFFGDDWGQQKGLLMGPKHWRNLIKPGLARMYERVHSHNMFTLHHSCGDIAEIYEELIEIGLDCHQTFQPEIYDIEAIKSEFGARLSFWGGISTQRLLPYATPEEVKSEARHIMGIMSRGGGFIVAPTHSVPFDVPPENIIALLEVFQNQ